MKIDTLTFEQFNSKFKEIPELEKKFRSAVRFFREHINGDEEIKGQTLFIRLFTTQEIADFRNSLDAIENQSIRINRNETLITDRMQDFVNAINIKERTWEEMIYLVNFVNNDLKNHLDQKTPVVQV